MQVVPHSLPYKPELDGLRGIAVLLVVFFHIWPNIFPFGFVGVDIFFVLSGYLITKIILNKLEQNNFSFLVFYRNRIRRILPTVVMVLAATSLVSWLFLFPDELIELSRHLFSSVLFYQNFQLLDGKGYWDQASQLKPLLHFWSLSIEEQFYIFWPLLLFFVIRTRKRIHWIALAFFLTAIISVSNEDSFYHSLSRFWELAFGASLVSFEKGEYWKKLQAWKWLVWLVFVGVIGSFSMASSYEHMHMLALCLVTGLLILTAVKSKDAILSNRALVFFGLISFPLYLWHYPIISFTYIFSLPVAEFGVQILLLSVALSFFTYRYVEYYARQQEGYGFSLLMVLLALTLAAWGYYVQQQKGLPERSEIQRITSNLESLKKPKARDDKCVQMVKSMVNETVYLSHCRLNVVGSNSEWMALIGDSHAYVMYPGIATQMVKQGMNTILMSRNSCPTLLGGARGESESHIKHCEKAIKQTYKVLDRMPNLQQVVIVSRGAVYINEKGYGAIESDPALKPRRYKSYYENRPYSAEKEFYQSFEDSIRYFYARNIKVSVMLENPELGFDIKQCIRRPFGLLSAKCRVSFKEYQNRMGEYRHNMKNIISKYENVRLLDPEPHMCDGDFCYGKDEGNILYADDDHLSVYGSEYLAEKFFNEARK